MAVRERTGKSDDRDVPHVATVLLPGAIGDRGMSLCKRGWHRVGEPDDLVYVRLAVRMRDRFGTYVYRVGPKPRDAVCHTIWCYGDRGKPCA